ncbi:helix-turn-helix domain-containing protein [Polymorphum gilvum]|uniref:Transcriptional regulator protein, AraC family for p-hydroxybenzoate hydroxylase protein n=1 Tax=Polymorphum gilvum (strain LMG 25793 / CGMCC 1.9160 / SL003B-26A1) TaxID=991905 RepID=F2J587_POLGS|nr:helix-turn-helix domain-containing protein [Polymorphum gilvum]ADZ71146.1 Transcriptional regulator protein, AraC family for p-hydroxybenzoate hydroxylase protein [Polymorphum gilvum SL003B-26A1]
MARPQPIPRYHLYGESDPATDFDFFHIETIRARSKPLGWSLEPHSHAHLLQCLLITRGGGRLVDDAGERAIGPGGIAFNPAGVMHGWTFTPETEGYVISFTPDYLAGPEDEHTEAERAALRADRNLLIPTEGRALDRLVFYFSEMADEFDHGARRRALFRPLVALTLLAIFPGDTAEAEIDRTPGFSLFRFRSLVEEHFRTERATEFYAGEMGLTVQRLNRYCRIFTGRTAAQALRDRVILEAKRLLAFSGLSVSQVAYDLGFEDPAYFSRVFRKETGESPVDFRARQKD